VNRANLEASAEIAAAATIAVTSSSANDTVSGFSA
jgi:hypothetical protein